MTTIQVPGLEAYESTVDFTVNMLVELTTTTHDSGQVPLIQAAYALAFADVEDRLGGSISHYSDGASVLLTADELPTWLADIINTNTEEK